MTARLLPLLRFFFFSLTFLSPTTSFHFDNVATEMANMIVKSPLYGPISARAKSTMIETAQSAGIAWEDELERLENLCDWNDKLQLEMKHLPSSSSSFFPSYFKKPFHTYSDGNLGWLPAFEQRLGSAAVGVRNYPSLGSQGETFFRGTFPEAVSRIVGTRFRDTVQGLVVDAGCGTGTSSALLAEEYPSGQVLGIDASPFMIVVGRELLQEDGYSERVKLVTRKMEDTKLEDSSADVYSISLCLHECTAEATKRILKEARRVLKPNGILQIMEMDGGSPGFEKLRKNPFLFSLIASTEPHLKEYFEEVNSRLPELLEGAGFARGSLTHATSRHYALVASGRLRAGDKFEFQDERDLEFMSRSDEHMETMDKGRGVKG